MRKMNTKDWFNTISKFDIDDGFLAVAGCMLGNSQNMSGVKGVDYVEFNKKLQTIIFIYKGKHYTITVEETKNR